MKGINSKLIHGDIASQKKNKDVFGALKMPVYDSASFEFDTAEDIENAFLGKIQSHAYSRITNPTISELENRLIFISDAVGCLCCSSGMAAISNVILSICQSGDNVVTTKFMFGNTVSLFDKTLKPFGIQTRYIDLNDRNKIEKNIDENTRAIFLENITNPHLIVFDIEAISKIAKDNNILLIIDNSLLTPYLFKSKDFDVDVEIVSTTKSISGGATSIGGAIIVFQSEKWKYNPRLKEDFEKWDYEVLLKKLKKEVYRNLGSCMSPHNAYLQLLGLETLTLRIDKSCENAIRIAEWLKNNKKVKSVNYPGLSDNKYYSLVKKQFNGRAGALLLFELFSREECFKLINNLKMIRRGTNFCDNKSLIIHPSSTIFCEYTDEEKMKMGITDEMIRFSVGIEDYEDIIDDINEALG